MAFSCISLFGNTSFVEHVPTMNMPEAGINAPCLLCGNFISLISKYLIPKGIDYDAQVHVLNFFPKLGGSVILESIFSINGMGLLFFQSAMARDYPVIMGILIISAFLTLLGNILADMILAKINPFFVTEYL